jgi:hypothetical protein
MFARAGLPEIKKYEQNDQDGSPEILKTMNAHQLL